MGPVGDFLELILNDLANLDSTSQSRFLLEKNPDPSKHHGVPPEN